MACKYTYGNQVYDSLDDLKVAVKNDLQRSADKEEVVDNNNQSNTAEGIYNKINKDKKTQSENVEIPGVGDMSDVTYSATTFWDKVVPEAVGQFGDQIIVAYRGAKKNSFLKNYQEGYPGATIGNPFDWQIETGSSQEKGIKSTKKFIHWMITGDNMGEPNATSEYRQAIIDDIKSGKLKNRHIIYYQEKGYATHATALDYLINKYDWNTPSQQSNTATIKSDNISYKNNPTNLNTYLNYLGLKDIVLNDAIFNASIGAISKERVFLNTLQQIVENTPVLSAVDIREYVAKDKQKDLPDLKPLAQRIHALSMALSQDPSEKDLREYVKLNTELNAKIIELLTPHIKKVFGKDASIEYKTIRSVDPLYNPQQSNTAEQSSEYKSERLRKYYTNVLQEYKNQVAYLESDAPVKLHELRTKILDENFDRWRDSDENTYISHNFELLEKIKSDPKIDRETVSEFEKLYRNDLKIRQKNQALNSDNLDFFLNLPKNLKDQIRNSGINLDVPIGERVSKKKYLEAISKIENYLSSQQSNTTQQPKTEITDAEVEAMTKALVEMYPEIELSIENNPNFVNKEGVFNQIEDNDFINLVTHDNLLTGNIVIGDSFATFTLDLKAGELKDISLAKELQGKGIGSDIYLKLNALLNRKGMVLKSSDNLSKASEALWESLYKKGYVEKTPAKIKRNYEDIIQEGVTDLSGKTDIVDGFTYKFKNNQQTDIQARKVLIDAAFKNKSDLVSHEFAHHYIAWFRNTPLVQQGIKMYGSEEELVEAIGKQAVVQKGKAWSWWKKFVAWLLNSANDVSDLTKENLRDILTDAFLSRQDLNKQAGTEAGVKLEKNVAVLGGETYLWNNNTGFWQPFTKSEADIEYSNDEMQRRMQKERDAKAQVKNDATMDFYQEDFDKMEAAGLIQFKNMYGDAKTFRYNKTSDAWYDVAPDNRSSVRTDIEAIEYEWYSAAEAADSYSWKNNTMQQLQNKQLNTHKSIALNRINRYNLLATINTSITNDITRTLDISAKQKNSGAVVDPKTNIIAAITMVGSKQGVGNMANAISGRSVLMPINAHTESSFYYSVGDETVKNTPLPIYLAPFEITEEAFINDEGEEDLAYSFGSLIDSQIRSVMFHLSEYLTLQVDAVKDPVAVALGYIKANLNLVSYLSSLGVTPERIAQFLAEPGSSGTKVERNNIITVWHDATESNENSFHKGKFFKTYKPSDYEGRPGYTTTTFIEKSNYKLKMEFVDSALKNNSTYEGVDVKQTYINKIVDGDRELAYHLNYAAIARDGVDLLKHPALKILYYWDLIEQAKQYAKSVKIINADGHHSKSMNNAVEHQNNVREQIENPKASVIRTSDLKKIISGEQSIVSGFFNAQKKYEEYFKKYFFSYERNIAPQLNKALKDRYNKSSEDDLTRLMSDAHNDFLVYLFFRMQNIDPSLSSILAKDEDGNILTPKELMYSDNDNPSEVSKLYTALTAISKPKNNKRPIVDPKYSGITRSTAVMLLKLLDTQLNITDARLLKDGRGVDTQSTLVDLIKLGEKISSAPTVNKYIEMFEELRNRSPEVFKIFTSLSLFQSGISNSPYNLFKGMPNTTKTKDGIIDILAKTVIAYDKFIDNSVTAGVIEAPSGWTPQQIATASLISDFLRWYDVQYGSYLLESDRKAYHTTSKAYRKFDSSTLKYEVRVKKGAKPDKDDLAVSMGRSKYVREFFKNVDNTYTVSEIEDIQEDSVAALGVLERYAKSLIEAGVEVNKLCQ